MVLKCFRNIQELWTFQGVAQKQGRHIVEEDLGLINNAAMLCKEGWIVWVGKDSELTSQVVREVVGNLKVEECDFSHKIIMPAFVEAHTHSVFAGDRTLEFELRNRGWSYQQIAEQGGGIVSTVKATRSVSKEGLRELTQRRVDRFLKQGVGTLEIKSGYSLEEEGEIKILQVIKELTGPQIVATYLGPHAILPDHSKEEYQKQVIEQTLLKIAQNQLARRVDIFVERGYFDVHFARQYFTKAKQLGFEMAAHVEQLSHCGGVALALEFGAKSVDHIVEINEKDIQALGKSETTAMLLPAADFYLKIPYPKARNLIEQGARVALATDFNPGSSPTQDLSFVGLLARLEMKMTLPETLAAYTLNAAYALGLESVKGSIDLKKHCDFIVLEDNLQSLFYNCGYHPISEVWLGARQV